MFYLPEASRFRSPDSLHELDEAIAHRI